MNLYKYTIIIHFNIYDITIKFENKKKKKKKKKRFFIN